jgi:hypothetical protein
MNALRARKSMTSAPELGAVERAYQEIRTRILDNVPPFLSAELRIKDAVCDVLRDATGERPSVDTHRPDLPLALYVGPEHATLYADTSGEALFKRGWRDAQGGRVDVKGEAPLKETLAAAMLAAAGWQGRAEDGPLLDPCCGAGTTPTRGASPPKAEPHNHSATHCDARCQMPNARLRRRYG